MAVNENANTKGIKLIPAKPCRKYFKNLSISYAFFFCCYSVCAKLILCYYYYTGLQNYTFSFFSTPFSDFQLAFNKLSLKNTELFPLSHVFSQSKDEDLGKLHRQSS